MEYIAGKYKVVRILGEGGFGKVYLAQHQDLANDLYAVKLMKSETTKDDSLIERFKLEATVLKKLIHPNSAQLRDFGKTDDGYLYMAMDFCLGDSLQKRLNEQGPMEESQAVSIAIQILEVLSEAHKVGIIHRDLKPDNIIIHTSKDGRETVKVLDFGIAKLMEKISEEDRTLTVHGAIIGTPAYMSPEQATAMDLDVRSDIYSVGLLLYSMLTGKKPFDVKRVDKLLVKQISEYPQPFSKCDHITVSSEVELIVFKALQKDRERRYASADEFRQVLRNLKDGTLDLKNMGNMETLLTRQETPTQSLPSKWTGEKKSSLGWWIAVVLLLIVGGLGAFFGGKFSSAPVDKTPPRMVIQDPTGTIYTRHNQVVILGFVDDHQAKIYCGKQTLLPVGGQFRLLVPLTKEGEQEIVITARNKHKQQSQARVKVVVDRTAPTILIESPKTKQTTQMKVWLKGMAVDSSPLKIYLDGRELLLDKTRFRTELVLREGKNRFVLMAKDKMGNQISRPVEMEASFTRPQIQWLRPVKGTKLRGAEVQVEFVASRPVEAAMIQGKPAQSLGKNRYGARIKLKLGANPIEAKVRDRFGRWTVARKSLIRLPEKDDSMEPNDRLEMARLLPREGEYKQLILRRANEDWYRLRWKQAFRKQVTVTLQGDRTLKLEIFGEDRKRRATSAFQKSKEIAEWKTRETELYLRVYSPTGKKGAYSLTWKSRRLERRGWYGEKLPPSLSRRMKVMSGEPPLRTASGVVTAAPEKAKEYRRKKDGVIMVYVPSGSFIMGSEQDDQNASPPEKPQLKIHLQSYYIDKYEITQGKFARFVKATGYLTTAEKKKYSLGWANSNWGAKPDLTPSLNWKRPWVGKAHLPGANHPVIHMTFLDSRAYAKWAEAKLPTEAQWEKAARGPRGRVYPWGAGSIALDGKYRANLVPQGKWALRGKDGFPRLSPVGSYPTGVSPYGCMDMAGNVWEWCRDYYHADYYVKLKQTGLALHDICNRKKCDERVLRGGSWVSTRRSIRAARRQNERETVSVDNFGFRCVIPGVK